ncbi:hypothetical protein AAFF_G00215130 [Aldrovandia affinis]|uniref:Uncharacterized protein n=1 Tax=Aldrovandia affinis TaxID=143900 RepID=A0AAD7RGI4_9TELE|nr:hypothetical protein AAFF_G00215130 [Aldrovandia affinis]
MLISVLPSHRGTAAFQTTFPSWIMHVMASDPCVLMKPSSQVNDTELPSRKWSPNRWPLMGMPGSWHSF